MGITVSKTDVAALAGVARQLVTVWQARPRSARGHHPFPEAVRRVGNQEFFDRDEVVRWLDATGRGNNADAAADAPTVGAPDDGTVDDVITLSLLRFLSGSDLAGTSTSDRADLARQVDAANELLLREAAAMHPSPALLQHVDELVANSFGPSDCLARIERGALARAAGEQPWGPSFLDLVGAIVGVAHEHVAAASAGGVALTVHGPGLEAGDSTVRRLAEEFSGIRFPDDDAVSRAQRRRAKLAQLDTGPADAAGVHLRLLTGLPVADALREVNGFALELAPGDLGIAVGSAAALTDQLTGELHADRADTLRSEHVPVALRLPRGLRKAAPRESLAVWILRKPADSRRPADDDLVHVADLDGTRVDAADLASDVAGALVASGARAYTFLRPLPLGPLTQRGPVVPRGGRATPWNATPRATHLDHIYAATLQTSTPLPGFDIEVAPKAGTSGMRLPERSLERLRANRQLTYVTGHRIDLSWASEGGTVPLLTWVGAGAEGIVVHPLRIDPFDLERRNPGTRRTEPGDVVIVDGRRTGAPWAFVDSEGGHLVVSPARILRLRPSAPVGPHALAALVRSAPAGTDWPTWTVPELAPADASALDAQLVAIDRHRHDLRRRIAALDDLDAALVSATAAGAVVLPSP